MAVFLFAFGVAAGSSAQFGLIVLGGFAMTCTVGPISAIVFDVVHPAVRSTGAAVLSLTQNLLGLAVGPLLTGWLSDACSLQAALGLVPLFGLLAAAAFVRAMRSYEADIRAVAGVRVTAE